MPSRLLFPLALLASLPLRTHAATATESAERPNILLIVSDDQGYADAGFQGAEDLETPHLDRLAASGIRFTNGYVTHPFCSPTRAGLLTGRYQQRFGHERNPIYDPSDLREGLPTTEKLLPEHLQSAGYVTGWIGKWHLGAARGFRPERRGFAETYGFIGGGHFFRDWIEGRGQFCVPIERNGHRSPAPAHLTPAFGTEAAAFIRRHATDPWFLYLAFNAPHTPLEPTDERFARFAAIEDPVRRKYAAQLSLMDDAVGEVLDALRTTGQAGRTIVFFFSDNGGPLTVNGSMNSPLRGKKGDLYEGGIRVPFLISWPDRIPAGRTDHRPVSSLDVFATSLSAAGVPMPIDRKYDSIDLLPVLTDATSEAPPHDFLFWRSGELLAVRQGDWKLVRGSGPADELYNLSKDVSETLDLSAAQPQIRARLATALDSWNGELAAPAFPGTEARMKKSGKAPVP